MIIAERINKSDARKLVEWWSSNTPFYYSYKLVSSRPRKLYMVYRV